MLIVQNTLISEDIADVEFCCDYEACLGKCCIEGDCGAPLTDFEIHDIKNSFDEIKKYLSDESITIIENKGFYVFDPEQIKVTPLNNDGTCSYGYRENETIHCAIEKTFFENKASLQKPLSCHLYPIRLTNYDDFEAVNYHEWKICSSALCKGKKEKVPLYVFLKDPLIRRYGKGWYEELLLMIDYYKNKSKGNL
jgi:hypothetical protein